MKISNFILWHQEMSNVHVDENTCDTDCTILFKDHSRVHLLLTVLQKLFL